MLTAGTARRLLGAAGLAQLATTSARPIAATCTAAAVAVCMLASSGCAGVDGGGNERGDGRVAVPKVDGSSLRDATCTLLEMHLRWRFRGQRHASARPMSGCGNDGVGSSMDDIRVTGQRPAPGTRVRRGSVVVLEDECMDLPPGRACL
jgi:hypothetical protein